MGVIINIYKISVFLDVTCTLHILFHFSHNIYSRRMLLSTYFAKEKTSRERWANMPYFLFSVHGRMQIQTPESAPSLIYLCFSTSSNLLTVKGGTRVIYQDIKSFWLLTSYSVVLVVEADSCIWNMKRKVRNILHYLLKYKWIRL